eukprot:Blabericola_migrator_1__2866@NODE_1820_length_3739_cov_99_008715_g185_i2_p1_GENE_NODE_1820_length_3739_cov_99_008715_g185_i2NODE_1820_length_3739_cov_99_008715_g185_i2_p1_ORF_typecomplete_len501_score71_41Hexokinase_2/PF03727_16/9_2e30Hexokinase_1/PF00349_21/9_1e26T2SSF/PF00482_23/0_47T2SSF/PF00482_23/9_8e02_NODE_1820_length_3739_cov_99_008715_g185_i215583060
MLSERVGRGAEILHPFDQDESSPKALGIARKLLTPYNIKAELFEDRVHRYVSMFTIKKPQVDNIYKMLMTELEMGCRQHAEFTSSQSARGRPSTQLMLDTFVTRLPSGNEIGMAYGLGFANTSVHAIFAEFRGRGNIAWREERLDLISEANNYPRGFLDQDCPAMYLFDAVARTMTRCLKKYKKGSGLPSIGFSMAFPLELLGERSARLVSWRKGFETGRATDDPIEGLDVVTELEIALWKYQQPCRIERVANDTVSMLFAGAYEKPTNLPPCAAALVVGSGFNGCYIEPNSEHYKYRGMVINTEIGGFDRMNISTDIDREILFHEGDSRSHSTLEHMACSGMLGEVCRRLVLRIWRGDSPEAAWHPRSMPTLAAIMCATDVSEGYHEIGKLLRVLWDWDPDSGARKIIKLLFGLVFERAAAMSACAIASIARRTGRLSHSMGGLTVALEAAPHMQYSWYQNQICHFLRLILGHDLAKLIHLMVVNDGFLKGAALLGWAP